MTSGVEAAVAAHRPLGRELLELLRGDPELRPHLDGLSAEELDREPDVEPSHSVIGWLREHLKPHPTLLEGDGSPVQCVVDAKFPNWGRTVSNTPAVTFAPRTKTGVANVVGWAAAQGKTVRASGYRHSWSDVFSADGQVLVSMLPLRDVEDLPAPEPAIDPQDQLQGIEVVGTVVEDGVTKALCRIGAGTTNEQFRRWCTDEQGGNYAWTIPLNVIMVEITWGGSNAMICHGAGRR